ncbi:MAG TPA: helix-turn-helix domain-containing protein [Edaphocola sp.]|nr:helix-turn-helix domain-containing protein [Edaphocola sp.]
MQLRPIKTEQDYIKAIERLEEIFDAQKGSPEGDELEILGILIEKYEEECFPMDMPDPVEAIKFRLEQLNYDQNDLADIIGLKSRASEILNRKRKLSLNIIRKLSARLHIPTEVLIQAY